MNLNAINSKLRQTFHEGEPWMRYRTLVDLLDREDDPEVIEARQEMLADRAHQGPGRRLARRETDLRKGGDAALIEKLLSPYDVKQPRFRSKEVNHEKQLS